MAATFTRLGLFGFFMALVTAALFFAMGGGLCSGGEATGDGRFVAREKGVVEDRQESLMWAATDNGKDIDWYRAKEYCRSYRGGGYSDWRMPTGVELQSLYDAAGKNRHGYHVTELIGISNIWVWTSETSGSQAANFDFTFGRLYWSPKGGPLDARVLPVRDLEKTDCDS